MSLSALPSAIVDRAPGKVDGRHGLRFVPAGKSSSRGHSGSRESNAQGNADAFTAQPSAAFPLTTGLSAAFSSGPIALLLQPVPVAGFDARSPLPKREHLAIEITAPNGKVHARSHFPKSRRLPLTEQ